MQSFERKTGLNAKNRTLTSIAVSYTDTALLGPAQQLALSLQLPLVNKIDFQKYSAILLVTPQRLELISTHDKNLGPIYVDFLSDASLYRYQHGGGRQQLLARAVGLHKKKNLRVCDISAGLGRDAFVLATLGAQMTLIERSPIIAALLIDGWQRAQTTDWVRNLSWQFIQDDSHEYLQNLTTQELPQVIYFDPMFPDRKKSALVKKEMRILREVVGDDVDAAELLSIALQTATERVVVKRPRLAEPIAGFSPSFSLEGQSSRFDIYLMKK